MFGRITNKQEQIILYLYEFKNTPERGVGPDPRITLEAIGKGTQMTIDDAAKNLKKLISSALVRAVPIGGIVYHYLTIKGFFHVEKVQEKAFTAEISSKGPSLKFEKNELKKLAVREDTK